MVFYWISLNVTVTAKVATQLNKFADFTYVHNANQWPVIQSEVTVIVTAMWLRDSFYIVGNIGQKALYCSSLSHVHVIEYGKFIKFFEWSDGQKNAWSTSQFTINILYCGKYA